MARLTALGLVTKWLVVPISLGLAGYYFIGPKVGGAIVKRLQPVLGGAAKAPVKPSESKPIVEEMTSTGGGSAGASLDGPPPPDVKVTVRPLNEARIEEAPVEKPRKRRRRRRRTNPTPATPAPSDAGTTSSPTESPAPTSDPATPDG